MVKTPFGIVKLVILVLLKQDVSINESCDSGEFIIVIVSKSRQFLKALFPKDVTFAGIVMDVNLRQSIKQLTPIEVTPLGIVMDDNFVQLLKQ
jgi:hypothetical protein